MKILIVSNLYPPHYVGGYEIRCAQVAEALRDRGHDVQVVTSTYGLERGPSRDVVNDVVVHRCLYQHAFPPYRTYRPHVLFRAHEELADARRLHRIAGEWKPDIINFWSMYGLSATLLPLPRLWGIPEVYWIEQWWMIDQYGKDGEKIRKFWETVRRGTWGPGPLRPLLGVIGRHWVARAEREGLGTLEASCTPAHVVFVSRFMEEMHRKAGLEFGSSEVIHGGVPVERFYQPVDARSPSDVLRLLYAGQLTSDRGLHTIIEALGKMDPGLRARTRLEVVGEGSTESDYQSTVKARVQELGLAEWVSFLGRMPHERMPSIYRDHDLLVFPSTRPEGLPLTMIEAMLAGCAVVTTRAGGAREVADLAELPTFRAGESEALTGMLAGLLADRSELTRIALRGQQVARAAFGFDQMMNRFVATLARLPRSRRA